MPQKITTDIPVTNGNYVPLAEKIQNRCTGGPVFFSVEFFPPKTRNATENLVQSFDHFRTLGAMFVDVTWHANVSLENVSQILSLEVADLALNYCHLNTVLHLTCAGLTSEKLKLVLDRAIDIGLRDILALRGDLGPNRTLSDDFRYASDLVRFIRQNYGQYFTVAVAGYPTKHPESASKKQDLLNLKEKVDAGADFIVTQLFFEPEIFLQFVRDCRQIGITVPILPGIMPIQSYDSLDKIARLSQLVIPEHIIRDLEPIKNNDEAVRNYGIHWTVELCRRIIESDLVPGLHFYTLNRQHATTAIVKTLGIAYQSCPRPLPWLPAVNHRRCSENVRPIFWSSRPKSYVIRTHTWNEFPNGRWGKVDSPAFGTLDDYHVFSYPQKKNRKKLSQMWGAQLRTESDVWDIFYCYISGEPNRWGHRITAIPWNDELKPETKLIQSQLSHLNRNGILTINSQPNINGADSSDPDFGWGSPNGYVYQKAYVEFFLSDSKIDALIAALKNRPLVNYQIINQSGDRFLTNCREEEPIAVTWGVFPGKEIIQPTIVDIVSFKVWKDEAFSLWLDEWATIYDDQDDDGRCSRQVLQYIHDNYCLVNLVDNQYPRSTCLWDILNEILDNNPMTASNGVKVG